MITPSISLVAILSLVLALGTWLTTRDYYINVIKEKEKARAVYQAEVDTIIKQRNIDLETLSNRYDESAAESKTQVENALAENRKLSAVVGGMRDKHAKPCGYVPSSAGPKVSSGRDAAGKLSREAEEFLLRLAAEADTSAAYATAARKWAVDMNDKGVLRFNISNEK